MQLAGRDAAAAAVLVEAFQPVQQVLQGADLLRGERAGFERGQRQVADLGAGVVVRQGGRVVGAHPGGEPGQRGEVGVDRRRARPNPSMAWSAVRWLRQATTSRWTRAESRSWPWAAWKWSRNLARCRAT
jgi:hypothetical protein